MYEFNLPRAFAFRPGGNARGMTMHESQSLSLERMAGRSAEFLLAGAAAGQRIPWRSAAVVARQCAQRLAPPRRRLHPG
jgi:Zn-dependent M32 family carboxypeptidase